MSRTRLLCAPTEHGQTVDFAFAPSPSGRGQGEGRRFPVAVPCSCLFFLLAAAAVPDCLRGADAEATDAELWAAARSRIAEHRQADVVIEVRDAAGLPLPDVAVEVQQTRHAFLFGCNIFALGRTGDEAAEQAYRSKFADVFNFATLPFYWWSYEREQGRPEHERTAEVAAWCEPNGITCKGHPLAWNYAEPAWLPDSPDAILRLQLDRIGDCVSRFSGRIGIWDVVNEATHFERDELQRRAPKLTGMWQEVGRIELTRQCFLRAREANPRAMLLINDYRVDAEYERLIEQLVDDQHRPLYNAVGIQSHQHGGTWNNRKIWDVCERFARFGVPLHFTETTIVSGERRSGQPWETTEDGEAKQANEVERFYTMLYSHPAVEAITWWDFSDRRAWQEAPAGLVRKDMSSKPAYETLHRLVKQDWWTQAAANTDRDGRVALRATLGDYRITVRRGGAIVQELDATVRRGQENRVEVRLP